jgi:hypothetical protein
MEDTVIACESYFQNKIDSLLVTTSWVDTLKEQLGMEAVSQIWGDVPSWYLWLTDAKGVYKLQLADAAEEEGEPKNKQGLFSIKCYPFPDTSEFATFSYEEKLLRCSPFFDDTQTPCFEEKENIADHLFNVAIMDFQVHGNDTMACFTLESMDRIRWLYPEETVLDFDSIKKRKHFGKGDIDRAVPGWQLAYPLFDRLLCMYAFFAKTKPIRVRVTRSPGFEYHHSVDHTFTSVDAPDIHRLTASVYFASPGSFCREDDMRENFSVEEEQGEVEILLNWFAPCGHFHLPEKSVSMIENAFVNPLWWSLSETEYSSDLSSTCGCH